MIKPHIFMMKMQKPVEKPGKYPGNHFNFGNIICHLKTLNIFIFWIRFVSQQISYYWVISRKVDSQLAALVLTVYISVDHPVYLISQEKEIYIFRCFSTKIS